jgi:hypothetical protein
MRRWIFLGLCAFAQLGTGQFNSAMVAQQTLPGSNAIAETSPIGFAPDWDVLGPFRLGTRGRIRQDWSARSAD